MIDGITGWIKGIIYTVLFASFLEFLLPSGQMRKFIRVVIGLFIMLAILQPLMTVLSHCQTAELLPVWSSLPRASRPPDDKMAETQEQLTQDLYRQELVEQIRSVVIALAGIGDARVAVELGQNKQQNKQGEIQQVTITLIARDPEGIAPVVIGNLNSAKRVSSEQTKAKVRRTVSELYQLPPQKIIVQ